MTSRAKKTTAAVIAGILILGGAAAWLLGKWETPPRELPDVSRVILVVIDTLRADVLGCYGYSRPTSPNIDQFAETGTVFTQARAQSPWTLPSLATILTGLYPVQHGAKRIGTDFYPLNPGVVSLAEILGEAGFATAAFMNTQYGYPAFELPRGFQTVDVKKDEKNSNPRSSEKTFSLALGWLKKNRENPFFLFVHVYEPHLKYEPKPEYRARFATIPNYGGPYTEKWGNSKELRELQMSGVVPPRWDRQNLRDLYDAEIAYTDGAFGEFLDLLETLGLRETSLLILTSDHGEGFWEHGFFEHGQQFFDEVIRIPLILSWPGVVPPGKQTDVSVGQLDIPVTILDAVGIAPREEMLGQSLLRLDEFDWEDRMLGSDSAMYGPQLGALVYRRAKILLGPNSSLHLMRPWDDPAESRDLAPANAGLVKAFQKKREQLGKEISRLMDHAQGENREPAELPMELIDSLRDSGYLR